MCRVIYGCVCQCVCVCVCVGSQVCAEQQQKVLKMLPYMDRLMHEYIKRAAATATVGTGQVKLTVESKFL